MSRKPNLKTREVILDTACRLFHERGYRGVSMDDIASAVGIKKPNLFHYYPSKDELGAAMLERLSLCQKLKIEEQFSHDSDPIRTVEGLFADSAARMKKDGCCRGCIIGNLAQELSDHHERLRLKIARYLEHWTNHLAAFLKRAKNRGYFKKEMNPRQSAESLLSLLEGATLFAKANKRVDALNNARKMATAYLKAYRK